MKFKEKEQQPSILRLFSFLSMFTYLIPGFDYRYNWSTVPIWLIIAANAAVFFGYVFIFFVFKENSYASTIIQVEKGQQVITTGPYAIVRHPMYIALLCNAAVYSYCSWLILGIQFSFFSFRRLYSE
jgi:protein-S-isoprenylcysteine O-methyltransferase Ste14